MTESSAGSLPTTAHSSRAAVSNGHEVINIDREGATACRLQAVRGDEAPLCGAFVNDTEHDRLSARACAYRPTSIGRVVDAIEQVAAIVVRQRCVVVSATFFRKHVFAE